MHSRPEGSSITHMESAKQVEKRLGRKPPELENQPDFPAACAHLWGIYTRLSGVSFTEIKAYCDLTGDQLERWEIDGIIAIDTVRLNPPTRFLW